MSDDPRSRLRHLRDSYGKPVKVFNEVRSPSSNTSIWSAEQIERAKRLGMIVTNLHIFNLTAGTSALK